MSEIAKRIDQVIAVRLAPRLKADGFSKQARTFRRRTIDCIQVVNVQASQWNEGSEGKFTVNLGLYHPALYPYYDVMRETEKPVESDCPVHERIGFLLPQRQDHWWSVDSSSDLTSLAAEIEDAWVRYGRPWMERYAELSAARELFLARNTPYLAAVVSLALAERATALKHLDAALSAAPPESDVAKRLRSWGKHHKLLDLAV